MKLIYSISGIKVERLFNKEMIFFNIKSVVQGEWNSSDGLFVILF